LPWPSLIGFVRLVSNPRIFSKPERTAAAWEQVEAWLDCPNVWVPVPTDRNREVLGRQFTGVAARANLVPDAHLAALAIEHGLTLVSTDGDFARFQGLHWKNPLESETG
jgi:toxin-antitoxin system PIN domain toxin